MDRDLRYRAICPICNRVFNSKFGELLDGKVVCPICFTKHIRYSEYFLPLDVVDEILISDDKGKA